MGDEEQELPAGLERRRELRRQQADRYFKEDLDHQRRWYSRKAASNKRWSLTLSGAVIVAGSLVTFLQLFPQAPPQHGLSWIAIGTAALGLFTAIARGISELGQFEQNWLQFRQASEGMKHEYRCYVNGAGPYHKASDEIDAYRMLVERVERVIGRETREFWNSVDDSETERAATGK